MEKLAVALCRVSTVEQRTDGNSLQSQQSHAYAFAHDTLKCEIDKLWSLDISSKAGKNINRKDLMEIKDYCKKNKHIKYFIVDKINRLVREKDFFYWFRYELKMMGVQTYWADPNKQDLNRGDKYAEIKTFFEAHEAEEDNKERTETTITKMRDRYLQGYRLSSPPQGYKKSDTAGLFVPDEPRFSLLKEAFEDIAEGKMDKYQALEMLHKKGYKTKNGKPLRIDKFTELLQNDYYAKFITVKRWDDGKYKRIKGLHVAMISEQQYDSIQQYLTNKRTFIRKLHNPDFPLANLFAHECGGRFTGANQGNKSKEDIRVKLYPKYRCRGCHKQINRDTIHSQFSDLLSAVEIKPEMQNELEDALKQVWEEKQRDNINYISTLKSRLSELEAKKNSLIIALAENPSLSEDFKTSIKKVKEEISELNNQIIDAEKIENDFVEFMNFSINFVNHKSKEWWSISFDDRKKCKQILFPEEIIVDSSEKVCTTQISTFLKLKHSIEMAENSPKNRLVELRGVAPLSKRLKIYLLQA